MIIYKITNKINGKIYIGQTLRSLKERFDQHKKSKGCLALYSAMKKHGKENFIIEQIDLARSLEELNKKETEWIVKTNSLFPNGYNLNTGGGNRKWSDESKLKMSNSHMGKKLSESHKLKIKKSVLNTVKEKPEKFKMGCQAMKVWYKQQLLIGNHPKRGKKLLEDSKKRISLAKIGNKNPMFGKKPNKNQLKVLKAGREKKINNLKKLKCHQNNKIYNKVKDAAEDLKCARSSISNVLIGFRKSCKGYTFEYLKG